jgi:hypothetical protein
MIANDPKRTPGPTSLNWLVIQAKVKIKKERKGKTKRSSVRIKKQCLSASFLLLEG